MSILKPIRGLDPDAQKNLVSFCRLDYPEYEIVFCIDGDDETVVSAIEELQRAFPQRRIRVLHGSGRIATNDKVAKLVRLVKEAGHEMVVISDSDVRVRPGLSPASHCAVARSQSRGGDVLLRARRSRLPSPTISRPSA